MGIWEEGRVRSFTACCCKYNLSPIYSNWRSKKEFRIKKKVSGKPKTPRKSNPKRSAHKIRANRKTARRIVESKPVRKSKRKPAEKVKEYVEVKFEPSTKPAEQPKEIIAPIIKQVKKRKSNRLVKKPDIEPTKEIKKVEVVEPLELENDTTETNKDEPLLKVNKPKITTKEIDTINATPLHDMGGGYVEYDGKLFSSSALKELRPDLFSLKADLTGNINTNFGTNFPKIAKKGDVFVRVDVMPNRIFKFDGSKWIEVNKGNTSSYLYDREYIKYLISKIETGEYDTDLLSENEKDEISEYLKNQNSWFYF